MSEARIDLGSSADDSELHEWVESLWNVVDRRGRSGASSLLRDLQIQAQRSGIPLPVTSQTPYVNTIPPAAQPVYPGDREMERRIKSMVRWNAMAMVVRANRQRDGIGGHISTYASSATLYEVGFNHYFRGREHPCGGDTVFFQGHASPGIYARAYLEGRLAARDLERFRAELAPGGGLPSYPHPRLMQDFWEYPTVSMGLGPIMAIYRARFARYLVARGLREPSDDKVWCFVGDGETDEPETLGAISLAARERLDNLIFVINCNLQRLDGPVRGNGKIVQELEAAFRGVGWNVIKVLWGGDWDELFAADEDGLLARRCAEAVDGDYLKYRVEEGAYIREHFFGRYPELRQRVDHLRDEDLRKLGLGGHDPDKVNAAYRMAVEHRGAPTVILAKTIKGYGLGEAGEGRNVTHQQKKLNEEELLTFRDRFEVPIPDAKVREAPFYRPPADSPEREYVRDRRRELGGPVPRGTAVTCDAPTAPSDIFSDFHAGAGDAPASTTMAFMRMLSKLLRNRQLGPRIVPIVPDEARTFGMEALFRQAGIYSSLGQLYEPVDRSTLLYYRESKDGQILEEGITEAGSMSSFIAAGTSHASHGVCMLPIFLFYSMFGFQRVGDLIWAAGDARARGFLVGGTAGRTTLAGEGLQHQDGHSHLVAMTVPCVRAYDPAYAYELAVIVEDGIQRMISREEDVFYYVTVYNEPYRQPPMPEGVREGIVRGAYRLAPARAGDEPRLVLLGSGPILNEVLEAQRRLEERGHAAEVWSVTSWQLLRQDALDCERWNLLHPGEEARVPWLTRCFEGRDAAFVAATDYVKALPDAVSRFLPGPLVPLGTDGFGRSDERARLREYFEVDADHVMLAALTALARRGELERDELVHAARELEIDPEKPNPMH